jgi:hypothetical protein
MRRWFSGLEERRPQSGWCDCHRLFQHVRRDYCGGTDANWVLDCDANGKALS